MSVYCNLKMKNSILKYLKLLLLDGNNLNKEVKNSYKVTKTLIYLISDSESFFNLLNSFFLEFLEGFFEFGNSFIFVWLNLCCGC